MIPMSHLSISAQMLRKFSGDVQACWLAVQPTCLLLTTSLHSKAFDSSPDLKLWHLCENVGHVRSSAYKLTVQASCLCSESSCLFTLTWDGFYLQGFFLNRGGLKKLLIFRGRRRDEISNGFMMPQKKLQTV